MRVGAPETGSPDRKGRGGLKSKGGQARRQSASKNKPNDELYRCREHYSHERVSLLSQ
jgi:hypothetical protein